MSKCWYCNNELTTGDNPKHFGICNKCYDEMFKSGDTIIRSFTNKISDLEAKLAESEKKNEYFADRVEKYNKLVEKYNNIKEEVDSNFVDGQKYNELREQKDKEIQELKHQLAESEKQIKDAREAGNMAVDSWCKNRRKYEAQIAEMQNKSFILYSMLYETLEKQGCENVASQIDQMTGWTYDKEADWLKGNRNYDQLKQQLAEKEKEIESLKKEIKEPEEIWNAHLAELKEKVKQKLAQEFTERINEMLKEKVEEKTIDLNNQIRMLKKNQYTKVEQMQNTINGYLKIIRAYNSNKNQKAIEQLEKVKENAWQSATDISCLLDYTELAKIIDNQIKELKGENNE